MLSPWTRAGDCSSLTARMTAFRSSTKMDLAEWRQFGRPSGLYIDRNDILYAADSQSGEKFNMSFRQGIRIGSVKDGKVTAFITEEGANRHLPEGVAADKDGNVFGGFTENKTVKKF